MGRLFCPIDLTYGVTFKFAGIFAGILFFKKINIYYFSVLSILMRSLPSHHIFKAVACNILRLAFFFCFEPLQKGRKSPIWAEVCQTVPKCWVIHAENRQSPMPRKTQTNDSPALGSPIPRNGLSFIVRCAPSLFDTYARSCIASRARRNSTGASKRPERQDSGPGSMPLAQAAIPDAV